MTTGEKTFSTAGREVKAPVFKPITPGNYKLTVGSDVSMAKADKPDAVPYINLSFEVQGSAESEGGKNKRVFHRFFIGMKPGRDQVINMDRENQLVAFAQALGTQLEGVEILEREANDAEGNSVKLEYLNPKQLIEWIKGFEGAEVNGRIKTEKGTGGYGDKSVIGKFLLADEA